VKKFIIFRRKTCGLPQGTSLKGGKNMFTKTREDEIETLKDHVSKLGKEFTEIVDDVKKISGIKGEHSIFKNLEEKFEEVKTQGEKGVKKVSEEIEQHPIVSVITAFGIGLIAAGLLYKINKK